MTNNTTIPTPSESFEFDYEGTFETVSFDGKPIEVKRVNVRVYLDEVGDFNASTTAYGNRIQKNGGRSHIAGGTYLDFEETRPYVDDAVARVQRFLGTAASVVRS